MTFAADRDDVGVAADAVEQYLKTSRLLANLLPRTAAILRRVKQQTLIEFFDDTADSLERFNRKLAELDDLADSIWSRLAVSSETLDEQWSLQLEKEGDK